MNKIKTIVIAVGTVMACGAVSAASLDVRHEYKHSSEQHATRVKMGDSIDNFYYSGELKFKGADGTKFLQDLKNNGWELDLGYRFKLNDNWTIQPGMPIEGRESGMTYKPQIRATYALDSVEGLSISARYRYDIRQNIDDDNQRRHRLTGNINYSFEEWRFGLEANYYKADGYDLYKDKDTNYEFNSTIRRSFGQWAPYAEFGYAPYQKDGGYDNNGTTTNNDYELRSRIGITYSF
ncbi:oligogalacturonate-specific porin KdgM family protein [Vibrio tubiashii]|uniref:oligogalacturonate-specific porin KdgM family protein n=1 Tax=Vibrio tubiashii TaxID=29498 RepID=UPI00234FA662|nr:oligogalacturonate-specific porin KdgM family protein [Vibrio tubiashii]WCP69938.1 oligogalacturonate-specific porin KdgM family protein [Vibrio tubiashii]